MLEHPYNRLGNLRLIIATQVPEDKLKTRTFDIEQQPTGKELILKTEGPRTVRKSTSPRGIVFADDSFLTVFEKWSIGGDLLAYKYHYQSGDHYVRYELDENKRESVPQHHMNISYVGNAHIPCGIPPVDFSEVLDMIVREFVP